MVSDQSRENEQEGSHHVQAMHAQNPGAAYAQYVNERSPSVMAYAAAPLESGDISNESSDEEQTFTHPSSYYAQDTDQWPVAAAAAVAAPMPLYRSNAFTAREPLLRSDSAPAARTTKTYKPKEIKETFQWDMEIPYKIGYGQSAMAYAVALLDPQSQKGNWITEELLERTGYKPQVRRLEHSPTVDGASGPVTAIGGITLEMKRREGNKYFRIPLWVLPRKERPSFELVLGRDFLNEHDIMKVNADALLPLVERDQPTAGKIDRNREDSWDQADRDVQRN